MPTLTKEQWRKRKLRRKIVIKLSILTLFIVPFIFIIHTLSSHSVTYSLSGKTILESPTGIEVDEMFLTPNTYSRPQTKLLGVRNIVIHYTGNPGSTGIANRNYFENLKTKHTTYASSHYIVGLDGEIIQSVPLNEVAYASNNRNNDTISIETCHPDATGKFNDESYASLVKLVGNLLLEYNLTEEDVIRHYDVTGKLCPLYYVENEDEWLNLKSNIGTFLKSIKKS